MGDVKGILQIVFSAADRITRYINSIKFIELRVDLVALLYSEIYAAVVWNGINRTPLEITNKRTRLRISKNGSVFAKIDL